MMTAMQSTCSVCGSELPPDAPRGLCPTCLFQLDEPTVADSSFISEAAATTTAFGSRRFGDYELLDEIARGGMGIVYKARQLSLGRIVALKMILFGSMASPEQVRRFKIEAAAAGSLQHPNIVTVHEVGLREGQHFLVMDYVDGPNLARLVKDEPLPARRAAVYLKAIAEAVQFAHEQGILHRDLKPSNVLIGSDDRPRVTDFGLAKRFDADSSLTLSGHVLGSPNYMPPEQAGGARTKAIRASDVYSLGAILYHLLTARPPFRAETLGETLHQVQQEDPIPPRLLNASVPRDLETICLRCLEKEPVKRFQTAALLAEELGRFLNDEPIQARPVTSAERAWRWCRRKPALASSLFLILILILILIVGSPIAILRINRARQSAELNLYAADMNLASQALENHNLRRTRELLGKHWPGKSGQAPANSAHGFRGWEWRYLYGQCHSDEFATLASFDGAVLCVCFSPDGRLAAAMTADGVVQVWDFMARQKKLTFQPSTGNRERWGSDWNHLISFSPDGKWLAVAGTDYQIRMWEISSEQELFVLSGCKEAIHDLAFSPDGKMLGCASTDGALRLWNLQGTRGLLQVLELPRGAGMPLSMAFAPNGKLLAGGSQFGHVYLWDISDPKTPAEIWRVEDDWTVFNVAFSPDGKTLAFIGNQLESAIRMFDVATHREMPPLRGHRCIIGQIAFSPDGTHLASAGNDWNIKVWNLAAHQEPLTLKGHQSDVSSVAFSADGRTLLSGSLDKTARLWDLPGSHSAAPQIGRHPVDVPFSPDSKYVVSLDALGHLALWEANGRQLATRNLESDLHPNVRFGGNSKAVFVHGAGRTRKLELPSLRLLAEFSRDKRRFAQDESFSVYVADKKVVRQETATGAERLLGTLPAGCMAFDLSLDGAFAACATKIGDSFGVMLFATGHALEPLVFKGHSAQVWCLAFSADNKTLATGTWDGSIGLWDLAKGHKIVFLQGHTGYIWRVAFTPDGRTLASCGDDTAIKFWNLASLQEAGTLHPNKAQVTALSFSPDGKHMASGGGGELKLWHAPAFEEITQKGPQ